MTTGGRRAAREASTPTARAWRPLIMLAGGLTLAVVAWGYLVWAAIDLGTAARGGRTSAWWLMAMAAAGAAACLFLGLLLAVRLIRAVLDPASAAPRAPGGRRAAR